MDDQIDQERGYNKDEHKYPLDYDRYMWRRKDEWQLMAKKKTNCCGNFSVSMFWEEKFLLLVRTSTLLGFIYIAFYE